jgi:folate-binding Fe-S cluster repair protein YgfZ
MSPQYSAPTEYLCLEARGADAGAFLHAQLSQALDSLAPGRAPLAGWHDARGRVRALLRVVRLPERWLLVTPRDGAEPLLKRLKMFVLRSAVTLAVATDVDVAAVLGADRAWLEARGLPGDAASGTRVAVGDLDWVYLGQGHRHVLGSRAGQARSLRRCPRHQRARPRLRRSASAYP